MHRILSHVRQNVVAYLALFIALGGTGYAAVYLPAGSVGANQIRNHVIEPVKFNRHYINGTVRAWAEVNADGSVQDSTPRATVKLGVGPQGPGFYLVYWKGVATPNPRGCFALSGLSGSSDAGSVQTSLQTQGRPWNVFVHTYDSSGQFSAQPFYVAVLC